MTKVLICDDSSVERALISNIVAKQNVEVVTVENGEQAIVECKNHQFDLVFLDLLMPGIDGWDTAKAIRNINGYQNTPIIAVSAIKNKLDHEKALYCGFDKLIQKPFAKETIISVINEILN